MKDEGFSIENTTKGKLPSLPFKQIKKETLGDNYELGLVFVDNDKSRKLNQEHRKKDGPANVLSFPLTKNEGEIFIDLEEAAREAPKFEMTFEKFITYLFIHGVLHLKGLKHGSRMEKEEQLLMRKFGLQK